MIYVIENDHKLQEYCGELNQSPNELSNDKFKEAAKLIGWVLSFRDYERYHNTNTMPKHYYIRIDEEEKQAEGIIFNDNIK